MKWAIPTGSLRLFECLWAVGRPMGASCSTHNEGLVQRAFPWLNKTLETKLVCGFHGYTAGHLPFTINELHPDSDVQTGVVAGNEIRH